MADYSHYIAVVQEYWNTVLRAYTDFEDEKPVILIDMQAAKVYAYDYREFLTDLSPRSQKLLRRQYADAIKKEYVVVFVRDNEKRKLISCSFPLRDSGGETGPSPRKKRRPAEARRKKPAGASV